MKRTILILAAVILGFTTANAQWFGSEKVKGNGNMETQNRSTASYDRIGLQGSIDMQLVAGKEGEIKVEAESNLQEYIITEVENGNLSVHVKKGYNVQPSHNMHIKVIVPFKDIEAVSLTGSGDVYTSDEIKAEHFEAKVTGSGDMSLDLNVQDLETSINGSGDMKLVGNASHFKCSVNGSGDTKAFDLKAEDVEAKIAGSGDIQVNATKSLEARVAGSGDIVYKGNPEKEDFHTTGSGDVSSY